MKQLKSILGYLGCICITAAVAYYIDGTAGIILTLALVCGFIFSLILTLAAKPFIRCEISLDRDLLMKGERLTLSVRLRKSTPLPAPIIEVEADCTPQLAFSDRRIFKGSVTGTEVTEIKIPLRALHSGEGSVSILSLRISDFLGILTFRLPLPAQPLIKTAVYPNIPDVAVQTDFLKTASQIASTSDDEEEESDEPDVGSSGMPGYEHRNYYPGDPIKKINWKLSSKRDIYMVRLDERVYSPGQTFFLDCPVYAENEYILTVRDKVIEGALAVFSMLVREGKEAVFYYFADGAWQQLEIRSDADVYALQEKLSSYLPTARQHILPPEILASGKTPICFSCAVSGQTESVAEIASKCPEALIITAEAAAISGISPNLWTISDEFEMRKQAENH